MRLQDKVAFISGSTRGIGRTTAEMFAAEGAKVVVSGRSVDKGEKVASRIREQGGDATFIRLDVSDESSVRDAIAATIERYGTLTTLINNAAPTDLVSAGMKPMHELTTEEWDAIVRATLTGNVFWASKYTIPHLIEAGGGLDRERVVGWFDVRSARDLGVQRGEGRHERADPHHGGRVRALRHPLQHDHRGPGRVLRGGPRPRHHRAS